MATYRPSQLARAVGVTARRIRQLLSQGRILAHRDRAGDWSIPCASVGRTVMNWPMRVSDPRRRQVERLVKFSTLSTATIARKVGVCQQTVRRWAKAA